MKGTNMAKAKRKKIKKLSKKRSPKPVKLTDQQIERRFGQAAMRLKKICKSPPYKVEDLQKALDWAELPVTITSEMGEVAVGLFVWALCDGGRTNALEFRTRAIERIKRTLPAAARA